MSQVIDGLFVIDEATGNIIGRVNGKGVAQLTHYDSMAQFTNMGGAAVFGTGEIWIAGQQYWSDGVSVSSMPLTLSQPASTTINSLALSWLYDNGLTRIDSIDVHATGKFMYINPASGNDANSRATAMSATTPWATVRAAYNSMTAGDGVYIAAGTYTADGSSAYGTDAFHRVGKQAMNWIADPGAVLKNTGRSNPLMFISTALPSGASSYFYGLTLDGENLTQNLLGNADMTTNAWTVKWEAVTFKNPLNYFVSLSPLKIGTFTWTGCTFTGSPTSAGFQHSATNLGASGAVALSILNSTFSLSGGGAMSGILQDSPATTLTSFSYTISGNTMIVESSGTAHAVVGINVKTMATEIVSNTLTINSPDSNSATSYGVTHRSLNAANLLTDVNIHLNTVNFNAPVGYAIEIGGSAFATTGVVEKNTVNGKYYASKTPHGIAANDTAAATVRYNTIKGGYAGLLAAKCGASTISSNLTVDCYGADLYAKGVQNATTFDKNTCVITGNNSRRNLGVISVDSQSGVLSNAVTMSNNIVLVGTDDISKINLLANIANNCTCTYSNNIYIIPDTIADSTVLFRYGTPEGGGSGTDMTIDQWRAATTLSNGTGTITVTNERVVKLPLSQIKSLISSLGL